MKVKAVLNTIIVMLGHWGCVLSCRLYNTASIIYYTVKAATSYGLLYLQDDSSSIDITYSRNRQQCQSTK